MGTNRRRYILSFCLGALLVECPLYAADGALLLKTADRFELEQMASLRGLAIQGVDDETLRSRLMEATGSVPDGASEAPVDEARWKMDIDSADRVVKDPGGDLVTLLGNVRALVSLEAGQGKMLGADKVVLDSDHSFFSAMGGVTYNDRDPEAAVQSMSGDIITLDWDRSLLTISGGTTRTERTNSKDQKVEFYTTGDEIIYDPDQHLIMFHDGYLTNNPKHAYSSITAKRLAVMDSGDMFLENAYLSIGRVPMLWFPYFIFPGSRMVGNPAIGIENERGWFVNTSFEIYGTYKAVSSSSASSFTRLLESEDTKEKIADGPVYRNMKPDEKLGPVETWARKSGSYLVFLADSYQNAGLSTGIVTENNFLDGRLSLKADGRLALTENGSEELTSYGSYPKRRYLLESSLGFHTNMLSLDISLPLYSDPKVKRTYMNRFTRFSLDHLWGAEWPTDYSSEITSYTWKASGNLNLSFGKALESLKVSSAEATALWKWKKNLDEGTYGYQLTKVTLPELKASMKGTLFSFSETKAAEEESEEKPEAEVDELIVDPLVREMLKSAYRLKNERKTSAPKSRSLALTYTVDERLTQNGTTYKDEFDWDATRYRYSQTKGTLTLSGVADPSWLTFDATLAPQYTDSYDAAKSTRRTKEAQLASTTKASIPTLGLTWTLSQKLYTWKETTTVDSSGEESVESESETGSFDKNWVTTHQIVLSRSYQLASGTLTPSMTWVLPPLTQSLTPAVSWKDGPWMLSGSFRFAQQEEDGPLEKDLLSGTVSFDTDLLTFRVSGSYQTQQQSSRKDFWYPFKSNGAAALKLFGFTFSSGYDFLNNDDSYGMHYFKSLSTGIAIGPLSSTWTWNGPADDLEKLTWVGKVKFTDARIHWWKKRCTFKVGMDGTMTVNWQNRYATNLKFKLALGFSIAEFLDVDFTMETANNSFFTYWKGDEFDWGEMWDDLGRSFDLFGEGNRNTNFNMSKLGLEIVHHMDDWTLNCKYTGSVVLSNNKYSWVPVVSVFLQWNTIPELKVDENWTKQSEDSDWEETSSVYSE